MDAKTNAALISGVGSGRNSDRRSELTRVSEFLRARTSSNDNTYRQHEQRASIGMSGAAAETWQRTLKIRLAPAMRQPFPKHKKQRTITTTNTDLRQRLRDRIRVNAENVGRLSETSCLQRLWYATAAVASSIVIKLERGW